MNFHIITLFPEAFDSYFESSIIGRAIKDSKIKVFFYNPRNFTNDKHRKVDYKPYGGGPGMVMKAEPVIKAIEKAKGRKKKTKIIFMNPKGHVWNKGHAQNISESSDIKDLIIVCGRYEGIDARIKEVYKIGDVSVGNFTLTGGELPAMILIDSISRFIPNVLGKDESNESKRNASNSVYTRPEVFTYKKKKYKVPEVLISGNHKEIEKWRQNN